MKSFVSIGTIFLALGLFGCGGGTYEQGVFREGEIRYSIGTPGSGWRRVDVNSDNNLAWANTDTGDIIQVNATCEPENDIPLQSLTMHLLIGFTERNTRAQAVVPMDGREALRTEVTAKLDGVPRELVLYVLKKDNCVYDFALVAAAGGAFETKATSFDHFVAGFTTEGTGAR